MEVITPDVSAEGAPAEPSSEQRADQSQAVTLDVLYDVMGQLQENLTAGLARHYQGLQGLLDAKVGEVAKATGVDRETVIAMQATARHLLGDAAFANLSDKAQLEALKAAAEAAPAPKAEPAKAPAPERQDYLAVVQDQYVDTHGPMQKAKAEADGLTWAEVREPIEALGAPKLKNGRPDWVSWHQQADKIRADAADLKHARSKPAVKSIDVAAAGSGGNLKTGADALSSYIAKKNYGALLNMPA